MPARHVISDSFDKWYYSEHPTVSFSCFLPLKAICSFLRSPTARNITLNKIAGLMLKQFKAVKAARYSWGKAIN